jgi:hypothetical protein
MQWRIARVMGVFILTMALAMLGLPAGSQFTACCGCCPEHSLQPKNDCDCQLDGSHEVPKQSAEAVRASFEWSLGLEPLPEPSPVMEIWVEGTAPEPPQPSSHDPPDESLARSPPLFL